MENLNIDDNPASPLQLPKVDQPLYPSDEVRTEYKTQCYVGNRTRPKGGQPKRLDAARQLRQGL